MSFDDFTDRAEGAEGYSGSVEVKNSEKRESMTEQLFYEAKAGCLVIHLPKRLDQHPFSVESALCETDLLLSEYHINLGWF